MKVVLNQFDTEFSAEINKINSDEFSWYNLKIGYHQRSDTTVTTEITFNTVSKEDLLKIADMFAQLAEEAN